MFSMFLTHNLSERKLRLYLELDGIPMPSCSVFNPDKHNFIRSYGEITFVLKQDKFLPPDREIKVFKYDGWTVRQPSPYYFYDEEKLLKIYNFLPRRYILESLKTKQKNRREVFNLKKVENLPFELKLDFLKKESFKFETKEFKFDKLLQDFSPKLKETILRDFKSYLLDNPIFLNNKSILNNDIELANQILNQISNDFFKKNEFFKEFYKHKQEDLEVFYKENKDNQLLNELTQSFNKIVGDKNLNETDKDKFFKIFCNEFLTKLFANYLINNEQLHVYQIDFKQSQKEINLAINSLTDSAKKLNNYFSSLNEKLEGTYHTKLLVGKNKNQQGQTVEIYRDYTIKNLVDFMKKGILKNGMINNSEGKDSDPMNISPSELKAMSVLNKEIKTFKKLKEEYSQLKTQNEVSNSFKDCMDDLFVSLNKTPEIRKSNLLEDYSEFQLFASLVVDLNNNIKAQNLKNNNIKTNHLKFVLDQYDFSEKLKTQIKEELYNTISKVRKLPTNYFELKIEQSLDFSDIKFAIIPENMPAKLVEKLKEKVNVVQINVNDIELFNKTLKESATINVVKKIKSTY